MVSSDLITGILANLGFQNRAGAANITQGQKDYRDIVPRFSIEVDLKSLVDALYLFVPKTQMWKSVPTLLSDFINLNYDTTLECDLFHFINSALNRNSVLNKEYTKSEREAIIQMVKPGSFPRSLVLGKDIYYPVAVNRTYSTAISNVAILVLAHKEHFGFTRRVYVRHNLRNQANDIGLFGNVVVRDNNAPVVNIEDIVAGYSAPGNRFIVQEVETNRMTVDGLVPFTKVVGAYKASNTPFIHLSSDASGTAFKYQPIVMNMEDRTGLMPARETPQSPHLYSFADAIFADAFQIANDEWYVNRRFLYLNDDTNINNLEIHFFAQLS
jgi:hypothetical protein